MALIFRRRYRPPRPSHPSNESPGGLGLSSWHQGMAACPPLSVCHPRPAPLVLQLRPPSGVNCEPARGAARGRPKWVCVRPRKKRAAPSAPRSGPPAATLGGGLQPGSLRVHDPCKEVEHGSRLGFPGRRLPRGPPAPGNVARDVPVLPKQARRVSAEGRGELGLDPAEPGLRAAGVPPPERSAGGGPIALTADRSPMTERTSCS